MLVVQVEDLTRLADKVANEFLDNSESIIADLYARGKLEEFLDLVKMRRLANEITSSPSIKAKKIVVVGQSSGASERDYRLAAESMGVDPNTIEFYLNYEDGKKMRFEKYKGNKDYCAILVGPIPHSSKSKGDYPSAVAMMEHEEGYPRVIKLGKNGLKLTTQSFMCGLAQLAAERIIG